jgi:long-chain acyl-CoA synthetase
MEIDLELYRREVRVALHPQVRLSVIDISPERPHRTLVFLHGYGGRAAQWEYQLRWFSNTNRVIALDLRGHGRSDQPESEYGMPTLLADLKAVLEALQVDGKFVLVGHSFGGAIASEYAYLQPERVERLVLIAVPGEFRLNPIYRLLLHLPNAIMRFLKPFTLKWLGAPPHVMKSFYEDTLSTWVGWSLFRSLTQPTLVIRGHKDIVFEKPMFERVARAIPSVEEVDVGASGHMVMLERREAVNRAISRFLEASPRSWRQVEPLVEEAGSNALLKERPWLAHYDEGVPYTIAVPRIPLHDLLSSAVRRFPSNTALLFEGCRITYRHLDQEANRFANALRSLGVEKGDRVMLILPNLPQMVIAYFGVLKAGGVSVFTLPFTDVDELLRQLNESGARALIALTEPNTFLREIQEKIPAIPESPLQHVILTRAEDYLDASKRLLVRLAQDRDQSYDRISSVSLHSWKKLVSAHSPETPELPVSPSDLAVIIYTGGTTDIPKGVMLSHRNLVANALQTRHWIPEAHEGRERFLCVLPFSHSYGLTTALNVPIALGATLILKSRFEVSDVLKIIQRYRPTMFPGVPQMYVAINDYPGVRRFGVASIKACISGSAPLPVEVQEAFEKLTHGRLVEGYGLTEASPVTHGNPLKGLRKVGSIGVPFPSTEARVVNLRRSNREVPVGQIGELAVRGPQVMLGYWQNPEETRHALSRDGWLLTGDVAQMDRDGYFRIIARKADMWYPSKPGEPAFPRDVEEVLYEVPQVKEAAVVAIAGQPIAFIIARQERPTVEALTAYCKRRLPPELVPRLVIFVDDFPRTFIGKVLRRELARRYEERMKAETPE